MNTFKKTTLALAISALAGGAMAQSAPAPAPEPEKSPITANVTVVNDYRYRGMSQTNFKPALQGGFDYAHESGLYVGNWNSTISWISDGYPAGATSPGNTSANAVSAPLEMDFYAGFKKELIGAGFASDIGVLHYYYATSNFPKNSCTSSTQGATRNACGANPNTTELYAAQNFTFGPLSGFVKVSYALSNIFGIDNSSGSYYPDLTLNYDTGFEGITINAHVGYQYVSNTKTISNIKYDYSYTDYKIGLTKDFGGGLSGAIAYVGTSQPKANGAFLWYGPNGSSTHSLGKAGGLISLTKTF
jgi:uncharacterized protein (TIGR02001 family)